MYITYDELIVRYPIIATWNGSQSNIENDLIYYAEREINSRLATHYTVPFSAGHPTIKDLCIDLSYYRTLVTKDPEKAEQVKDAVIGRIEDLKSGKEYIMTDSYTMIEPSTNRPGGEIWSTLMEFHPVHSMLGAEDSLTVVDSNYLEELENERS